MIEDQSSGTEDLTRQLRKILGRPEIENAHLKSQVDELTLMDHGGTQRILELERMKDNSRRQVMHVVGKYKSEKNSFDDERLQERKEAYEQVAMAKSSPIDEVKELERVKTGMNAKLVSCSQGQKTLIL